MTLGWTSRGKSPPILAGLVLKEGLVAQFRAAGHEVVDFGSHDLNTGDAYPDFVIPLA